MKTPRLRAALGALLLAHLALTLSASCAAVVAGGAAAIGYVYYDENEAHQDFDVELEDAWDATIAALQSQNYPVSSSTPLGPTEGEIEVDDVFVRVEQHTEFTRVRVRIGTFKTEDHECRSGLLLEAIAERLN